MADLVLGAELGPLRPGRPGRPARCGSSVPVPGATTPPTRRWPRRRRSRSAAGFDGRARRALARFAGAPRRYEFRGEAGGVTFVDDYGHLPGRDARRRWPRPATAGRPGWWPSSSPTATPAPPRWPADFAHAFDDADVVVVTDVYSAGERPDPGRVGPAGRRRGGRAPVRACPVHYAPGPRRARRRGRRRCSSRATSACTLGAGDLTTLPDELLADLAR